MNSACRNHHDELQMLVTVETCEQLADVVRPWIDMEQVRARRVEMKQRSLRQSNLNVQEQGEEIMHQKEKGDDVISFVGLNHR